MRILSIALLAFGMMLTGCSKKQPAQTGDSGTSSGNPVTAPVDYLGAVGKANTSAKKTIGLVNLSEAIKMFEAAEGRSPKKLDELVEKGYLKKLPAPPTGMKFSYDPSTAQVKVVPAQ